MHLLFSEPQRLFRAELRRALGEPAVRELIEALDVGTGPEPDPRPLLAALGERGLLAVDWPSRYGGRDATAVEAAIVCEELIAAGVPDTMFVNSVQIVGLFLLLAGTDEQRERVLPGLAAGRLFASVLYTEPDAGSDLGALTTTATADGDGYRLTGRKKYSLKSHLADLALCAARTSWEGSRYEGITLFLVDLRAPGVTVTAVPSIATERFNEVILDDVAVGPDAVVGTVGQGWPLLLQGLAIERTGMDYAAKARRWLDAARRAGADHYPAELARLGAQVDAARLLAWRVVAGLARGTVDEFAAAMAKWYTGEVAARVPHQLLHLTGPPDPATAPGRVLAGAYRDGPGQRLSAGTSEVMLQVVASHVPGAVD